jgi:hypothetical protein
MDPEHIQVHSGSAVLYVNNEYYGLYTVSDHVDRHLMAANGLQSTGNLYKAVTHAARFEIRVPLEAGLEKKEGLPEDDFSDLWQLITFIDTMSDADFENGVEQWLDIRDYSDWWVFVSILRADDSIVKNAYHYVERPGAAAKFIPWDFNASFGQLPNTVRVPSDEVPTFRASNRIFERLWTAPARLAWMRARRLAVLDDVLHPDKVDTIIDGYLAEIDSGARRDWAKWEPLYRDFGRWRARADMTSYDEEVAYVRSWYREHWAAIKSREAGLLP